MLKNALRRLVAFSIGYPRTVIGIVLAITLVFLFQLPKIVIDTDPENMLEETQPERVFYAKVKKEFGINEFIVLGITDSRCPTRRRGCSPATRYSRSSSQQLAEMEALFDEMKGLWQGKLTLSVVNTANYFTPQLLAKFCQQHPNINVILHVANRDAVLKQLADNSTDLAIMGRPPDGLDVSAEPFLENQLIVIAAPGHPLAKLKHIKFAQLAHETFLSREKGSGTRSAMVRIFAQHHIQPHISMEMETNEAIKQAVQANMGLGILSLHSIELELETKRLVILNVENFPLLRHWFVAHRSSKRLTSAALAFKAFLLGHATP
ncbi:MAG: LysR substrate-binding domain-containing protein [Gallionellaceae bacterium]|nr:LysR substrate-binding domain-containing protein [Gallionellaceae bacterium]